MISRRSILAALAFLPIFGKFAPKADAAAPCTPTPLDGFNPTGSLDGWARHYETPIFAEGSADIAPPYLSEMHSELYGTMRAMQAAAEQMAGDYLPPTA